MDKVRLTSHDNRYAGKLIRRVVRERVGYFTYYGDYKQAGLAVVDGGERIVTRRGGGDWWTLPTETELNEPIRCDLISYSD